MPEPAATSRAVSAGDLLLLRRQPTPAGFGVVELHHRGDRIAFEAFPDLQIEVADVLGDRA